VRKCENQGSSPEPLRQTPGQGGIVDLVKVLKARDPGSEAFPNPGPELTIRADLTSQDNIV